MGPISEDPYESWDNIDPKEIKTTEQKPDESTGEFITPKNDPTDQTSYISPYTNLTTSGSRVTARSLSNLKKSGDYMQKKKQYKINRRKSRKGVFKSMYLNRFKAPASGNEYADSNRFFY